MGRTSKFTFPYPGRKRGESKSKETTTAATQLPGLNQSKAQKILGTGGDLNIDSPIRDDASYRSFRPASRGMSIAVSESTHDGEESYISRHSERKGDRHNDNWDAESGVLPPNLRGKASSTLLGRRFYENGQADTSSMGRRLRGETSSSTLRSHYDRQKSPLSISQQTSASSIRDQALRKGFPPAAPPLPRSPLLQVDHLDEHLMLAERQRANQAAAEQASKKKPTRLDLSRLFSRKDSEVLPSSAYSTKSPSVMSPASSRVRVSEMDGRRKLAKVDSRSKISQSSKPIPNPSVVEMVRPPTMASQNTHDRHAHNPYQQPTPSHISKHPQRPEPASRSAPLRSPETLRSPLATDEQFSWNAVRASIASPPSAPWDNSSFTSNSSRNTKESRRTSASVFSNSDLRNNSVLSLSSDEGSDGDNAPNPSRNIQSHLDSPVRNGEQRRSTKRATPPAQINVSATTQRRMQDENFLTIPMPSPAGSRISGPWYPKRRDSPGPDTSDSSAQDPRDSRRGSVASVASSATGRSSRVMTVTKQEEALLEALRQKRARMKDEVRKMVIAEQEENDNSTTNAQTHTRKSSNPDSRSHQRSRDSKSSLATLNAATYSAPSNQVSNHSKHRIRESSNSSQRTITKSNPIVATRKNLASRPITRTSILANGNRDNSRDSNRDGNRDSQASTATVTTSGTINLYLDRAPPPPLSLPRDSHHNRNRNVEAAEPSPDLSDFLSFGSDDDEDETPRTSWIVREQDRGHLRESLASLGGNINTLGFDPKTGDGEMPVTPKSRARLSAVGLKREDSNGSRIGGMGKGVTFVEENVPTSTRCDFLDDGDDDVVWGM